MQFAAKNLLQGSLCIHQYLCYCPIAHHNHPAICSIQHSVGVCSSGISDVCHVGSGVPLSVEVSARAKMKLRIFDILVLLLHGC